MFFIFYDPLEFLTEAGQTPTGQEMAISHLCVMQKRQLMGTLTFKETGFVT